MSAIVVDRLDEEVLGVRGGFIGMLMAEDALVKGLSLEISVGEEKIVAVGEAAASAGADTPVVPNNIVVRFWLSATKH